MEEVHRHGAEDDHESCGHEQNDADFSGGRGSVHQPAHRRHQMTERVHINNCFEPTGHRLRVDEGVTDEGEWKHDHHARHHKGFGCPHDKSECSPEPRQAERKHEQECHRRYDADHTAIRSKSEYETQAEDQHGGNHVPHGIAEQRADDHRRLPDRQRPESIKDSLTDIVVEGDPSVNGDEDDAHR